MTGMNSNHSLSKIEFRAMGTDISIDVVLSENISEERAQAGIEMVKTIFEKYEQMFSRFRADSELSKINKKTGEEIIVAPEMFEVLSLCLKYNRESQGYFDPRVIGNLEKIGYDKDFKTNDLNSAENSKVWLEKITGKLEEDLILNKDKKTVLAKKRIDTTGIAKGYIVDRSVESLKAQGFKNFIVDAGGDMFAEGLNEKREAWQVGVEGYKADRLMLKLSGEGIATSGISRKRWQRGSKKVHHLINPRDPDNFSHVLKTVTVVKDKTVEADGKAKVLFLMGRPDGMKFANENNLKALFLDYKGNVYLSEAIKENIIK
jgi:FAD:protein FMN transferase